MLIVTVQRSLLTKWRRPSEIYWLQIAHAETKYDSNKILELIIIIIDIHFSNHDYFAMLNNSLFCDKSIMVITVVNFFCAIINLS